jgi:hypothetical protein
LSTTPLSLSGASSLPSVSSSCGIVNAQQAQQLIICHSNSPTSHPPPAQHFLCSHLFHHQRPLHYWGIMQSTQSVVDQRYITALISQASHELGGVTSVEETPGKQLLTKGMESDASASDSTINHGSSLRDGHTPPCLSHRWKAPANTTAALVRTPLLKSTSCQFNRMTTTKHFEEHQHTNNEWFLECMIRTGAWRCPTQTK